METPAQMCARLAIALEDLVEQESASLQTRDFAAVVVIQQRAAPLIEHLAAHAADVTDEKLRARIAAIVAHRHKSGAWLSAEIERTRQQLQALEAQQRRVAKVGPAYANSTVPRSQLCAVG